MKYAIVIERTPTGSSAHSPDVPGCVAAARTAVEARTAMTEALTLRLEGLLADGQEPPRASAEVEYVEVGA